MKNVLNETEIEQGIIKILRDLIKDTDITEEELRTIDYAESNLLDSILFVTLVVELENEFGILIDDNDLEIPNLSRLESIANMVKRLQLSS